MYKSILSHLALNYSLHGQGHMARGENGPEHSAPAPGLVLAPGLPAFPGENGSFQGALHLLTWAMSMKRPTLNSHYNTDHS